MGGPSSLCGEYPGLNGGTYPGPDFVPGGCNGLVDTEIYDVSVPPAGAWTAANPPATLIDPTQPPPFSSPVVNNQGFVDMISETSPTGAC